MPGFLRVSFGSSSDLLRAFFGSSSDLLRTFFGPPLDLLRVFFGPDCFGPSLGPLSSSGLPGTFRAFLGPSSGLLRSLLLASGLPTAFVPSSLCAYFLVCGLTRSFGLTSLSSLKCLEFSHWFFFGTISIVNGTN